MHTFLAAYLEPAPVPAFDRLSHCRQAQCAHHYLCRGGSALLLKMSHCILCCRWAMQVMRSSMEQYLGIGSCTWCRNTLRHAHLPQKCSCFLASSAVFMLQSILAVYQVASRTPPRASLLVQLEPVTSAEVR